MSSSHTKDDPTITGKIRPEKHTGKVLSPEDEVDSKEVDEVVTNIDATAANSSNMENTVVDIVLTIERNYEETLENPTVGIEKNSISDTYLEKSCAIGEKSQNLSTIEIAKPLPTSTLQADSAGSSNTSFPIVKPPSYKDFKYGKVELYAPDSGPRIYNVKGNIISRPIITKNLQQAFRALPIHGKPESRAGLKDFYEQKIRDYIGYGISDSEFAKLHEFMDGDYLRTGLESTTPYSFPSQGQLSADLKSNPLENGPGRHLCIVKKLQLRLKKDRQNHYPRKLKYRGLRMLPLSLEHEEPVKDVAESSSRVEEDLDGPLEPGRDLIFRARIYRPHSYGSKDKDQKPTRHSVFNNDLVILGRQRLTAFRDRMACANDLGMRIDVSENPDCYTNESAKRIFPSGFLFINNVFYVDKREGCLDHSAGIREWARRRGIGDFPVRDMGAVRLDQLVLRLGHPEVYMHQGKCEHLFTFSEVRLLSPTDPLHLAHYPCFTHISQNQSVYCTTCAEFGAKWIVVGCSRVPFDPAFFCDTCFRFYLYDRDGKKIGDFKAYSYKGNTVNFLKPIAGRPCAEGPLSDDENSD